MTISLAIAAPAALAAAAYITAKTQLDYDFLLIRGLITAHAAVAVRDRKNRVNLFYELERQATTKSSANREFLVYQDKSWTYKEAYEIAIKFGTWLKKTYAIAPREVVAMDFMNSPLFVFLWMGIWSIGATPAFINYNLTGDPLIHSVKSSTARVLFVDEEIKHQFSHDVVDKLGAPNARDGKGSIQTIYFNAALEKEILSVQGVREPDLSRKAGRLDLALLIFTSGTTGLPKPGLVSWQKCLLITGFVPLFLGLKTSDRFYTCMPLYHSSAAMCGLNTTLVTGNTLILGHRFSHTTFWPEVRSHRATVLQYVGETCRYLLNAEPQYSPTTGANLDTSNSIRLAFGNGLRPDVWERFKSRFDIPTIAEFYGATEGVSATWNLSSNNFASGAIGRNGSLSSLILKKQIALVAVNWDTESPLRLPPHNYCQRVPTGQPGELLFKVDAKDTFAKFQGYFNNSAASEAKILYNVFTKGDAYVRSGDVLRWDKEGLWYFVDRIGDTFRWKSENVSTAEVAQVLGMHPDITEANVYGVEIPHSDGRAGCAAILFRDGVKDEVGEEILESVAKHAFAGLPKYSVPVFLRKVGEVKATGNMKQMKAGLRGEGIDPGKVGGEKVFWLKGGRYVEFTRGDWEELRGGRVKL